MKSRLSLLAVFFFAAFTQASAQQKLDLRWLPWIGAWTPVIDSSTGAVQKDTPRVFIVPNPDGQSVRVTTLGTPLSEQEVLRPDGVRAPVNQMGCTGTREMRWSADGTRLLSRSDLKCAGVDRKLLGIMLLDRYRYWIDIQVEEKGEHPGIWIQRYMPSGSLSPELMTPALAAKVAILANAERAKVSRVPIDPQDVIEAFDVVGSDAVEAMLVETGARFRMDSKLLKRLAAAKVPDRIIDIMVALSFPDRFVIDRGTVSPSQRTRARFPAPGMAWDSYSLYGFPFWYSAYPYSRFGFFDPWFGYGGYWQYYPYNGGGYYSTGGSTQHGIVVAGSGYTRISDRGSDRQAHPRYGGGHYSGGSSGSYHPTSGSSSSSSSGWSSGGSSSGGSSSGGSVSSSGYSSGGSSGGGSAHARP